MSGGFCFVWTNETNSKRPRERREPAAYLGVYSVPGALTAIYSSYLTQAGTPGAQPQPHRARADYSSYLQEER